MACKRDGAGSWATAAKNGMLGQNRKESIDMPLSKEDQETLLRFSNRLVTAVLAS